MVILDNKRFTGKDDITFDFPVICGVIHLLQVGWQTSD